MLNKMSILYFVIWHVVGFSGFVYWWTFDDDVTTKTLFLGIFVSMAGPCAYIIGWMLCINRPHHKPIIWFKRKVQ